MIRDELQMMSDDQAVTVTAPSTDVLDLGVVNPNQGHAPAWVVVEVTTAFANATSMIATLQESATEGSGYQDTTPENVGETVLEAALIVGNRLLYCALPDVHLRFLRINYTVNGTHNAGAVDAYVTTIQPPKPA